MSIKIISKQTYVKTCERCGCNFSFESDDLKEFSRGSGGKHTPPPFYGVECPCCEKRIQMV